MSKRKRIKFDPLWAQAKTVCRLNQQDIAMAKQLGLSPRALMKNRPSPSQQWKAPVKQWIRHLHAKRFGQKNPPTPSHSNRPAKPRFPDDDPWDDPEKFRADMNALLPSVEFDLALQVPPDDPEWQNLRMGRRQKNLCWTATALTVGLREVPVVDRITLYGSVAHALRDFMDLPWSAPESIMICHTLNLALWLTDTSEQTLATLALITRQTLASLADFERIAFGEERLELLILQAGTNQFLGRLRLPVSTSEVPGLEVPVDYLFRLEPLVEPQAVRLFQRALPRPASPELASSVPVDDDIP
ncbi:MAG TPA: hypothetical protein VJS65_17200, partial [Verrucomicrobiae bacterium]|nr:hypothetical protein [Verrucomicrobiae bacterium]